MIRVARMLLRVGIGFFIACIGAASGFAQGRGGQGQWIEGDSIRYLLSRGHDLGGEKLAPLLNNIRGLEVRRADDGASMGVALILYEPVTFELSDPQQIGNNQLYRVYLPEIIRFQVKMNDGVLQVYGMDRGPDSLNFKIKLKYFPDTVYLRGFSVDLLNGKIQFRAAFLGKLFRFAAKVKIQPRAPLHLDVWKTLSENADILVLPFFLLIFSQFS